MNSVLNSGCIIEACSHANNHLTSRSTTGTPASDPVCLSLQSCPVLLLFVHPNWWMIFHPHTLLAEAEPAGIAQSQSLRAHFASSPVPSQWPPLPARLLFVSLHRSRVRCLLVLPFPHPLSLALSTSSPRPPSHFHLTGRIEIMGGLRGQGRAVIGQNE